MIQAYWRICFLTLLAGLLVFGLGSCATRPPEVVVEPGPFIAEIAIDKLTQDLLVNLPSPLRIGLDDFVIGNSRKSLIGRYLGQLFVTALVKQAGGAITAVDRQIQDNAQAIASATIIPRSDQVIVSIRVVETTSGDIIAAASVSIIRDADIDSMIPPVL